MKERFDFGEALRRMKDRFAVTRAGWNGKGMHVYLETWQNLPPGTYEPCIVMFTAQEKRQPGWLASQADMLADDWMLAD